MAFIETSARDCTNVDVAFERIISGKIKLKNIYIFGDIEIYKVLSTATPS